MGLNYEGINIFVKALIEAVKIQGGKEKVSALNNSRIEASKAIGDTRKVSQVGEEEEDKKRLPSISSKLLEHEIELVTRQSTPSFQGQKSGLLEKLEDNNEAIRKPSISSEPLEHDIGWATQIVDRSKQDNNSSLDTKEEICEEALDTEILFQPVFQGYFEALFKAVENQIKEALAKKALLDDLKKGLFQNQHGKALRETRETIRSMEIVNLVNLEGAKYPVFLSYANTDKDIVTDFFSGETQEDNLVT